MYNDDESEIFEDWSGVLSKMLDMQTMPTILFYEQISPNDDSLKENIKAS